MNEYPVRQWDFYAEVPIGAAQSMLGDLGYNPNGGFGLDQTGRGVSANERSAVKPEWMVKLKAVLDEQGILCTIR